jgi:hypothetical protein
LQRAWQYLAAGVRISCGGRQKTKDPLPAPLKRGELEFKVFSFSSCKVTKFFADLQIFLPKIFMLDSINMLLLYLLRKTRRKQSKHRELPGFWGKEVEKD